ncbi:MAG: sucrase ferredoxin [Labedaea sp.]
MTGERCSAASTRRNDPLAATAPPVLRWLLVEQPGPWGPTALRQSRLPAGVADALAAKAHQADARLVLIRRVFRSSARRRWAFADSRPGHEGIWWGEFDDPAELGGLELAELGGVPSTTPVYLVCTHGKHDACCALHGRPLAAALAAARPAETWECSHIGGDRFAGNLVTLPHGFYYGRVPLDQVVGLAVGYEAGTVDLRWLRGRSSLSPPAQAAQHFVRLRLGELGRDALRPAEVRRLGHELWRVELDGGVGVTVRAVHERSDTPLTCSARVSAPIKRFELVES